MIYNYYFDIAAVVICLLCLIFYRNLYANPSKSYKCYTRFLVSLLLASFLDAVTSITISYADRIPLGVNYALNELYFICAGATAFTLSLYISSVVNPDSRPSIAVTGNYIIFAIYTLLCATNSFTNLVFGFPGGSYAENPGCTLIYILLLYHAISAAGFLIYYRKSFKKRELITLSIFIGAACAGILLQMLMTTLLIAYFIASAAAMIVLLGFETPDFKLLKETTRQLEEKQTELEEAVHAANSANIAKGNFLRNMSHDIRTPMNAIIGFTALALEDYNNPAVVCDYLEKIKTSGDHLLALINDILDMGKIENGKLTINPYPTDLLELLKGIGDIFQSEILAKQHHYVEDFGDITHNCILCDRLRLNQILLNCIGNSIKFTPKDGTVRFSVRELPSPAQGTALFEFSIIDNGIGMSKEFLSHIFEPFERERTSTISKTQGTGIGMAITKNLVTMMHGTIHVESEQNKGTGYFFIIPFDLCDASEVTKAATEAAKDTSASAATTTLADAAESLQFKNAEKQLRFLLVDDNSINRLLAKAVLDKQNILYEEAENGWEAIDILSAHEPDYFDLVLLDIQMPVMNGYETADTIRQFENERLASIPIIAMTADAFEEDRKCCLDHGMNDHLAKPFKMDDLISKINKVL